MNDHFKTAENVALSCTFQICLLCNYKTFQLLCFFRTLLKGCTTGSEGISWIYFYELHRFLGALPVNDSSLVEECVDFSDVAEVCKIFEAAIIFTLLMTLLNTSYHHRQTSQRLRPKRMLSLRTPRKTIKTRTLTCPAPAQSSRASEPRTRQALEMQVLSSLQKEKKWLKSSQSS